MTIAVKDANNATQTVKTIDDLAADGGQATIGTKADVAVVTDTSGSVIGFLRGLVKLVAAGINVVVTNANNNNQAPMAASAPVVIASNQSTLAVAPDTSQIANGASGTMLTPTKVKISIASATTTTLVALVAGKKIRILSLYLVSAAANTVTLQSHTTTTNSDGGLSYAANGGIVLPFNPLGWFDTTVGEALDMVTSGAGQVSGQFSYVAV